MLNKLASTALIRYILKNQNKLNLAKFNRLIDVLTAKRAASRAHFNRPFRASRLYNIFSSLNDDKLLYFLRKYQEQLRGLPKLQPRLFIPRGAFGLKAQNIQSKFLLKMKAFLKGKKIRSLLASAEQARRGKIISYRETPNLLQSRLIFKPSGQPVDAPSYNPKKYLYGAKYFDDFILQYRAGQPLWFSQFPQVAQDYLNGLKKPGYLYDTIIRLKRPGLKHQGFRPVSTAESGISDYALRWLMRKRKGNYARWLHGPYTGHPLYLTVIDNSSGSVLNVVDSVFGINEKGQWVPLDWKNPVLSNRLRAIQNKLQ